MTDETTWQRHNPVLLTACWSWNEDDETSCEGIVLPLTHCWSCDETCLAKKKHGPVTHILFVGKDYLGFTGELNKAPAHSLLDQMCVGWLGKVCNEFTSCFSCNML